MIKVKFILVILLALALQPTASTKSKSLKINPTHNHRNNPANSNQSSNRTELCKKNCSKQGKPGSKAYDSCLHHCTSQEQKQKSGQQMAETKSKAHQIRNQEVEKDCALFFSEPDFKGLPRQICASGRSSEKINLSFSFNSVKIGEDVNALIFRGTNHKGSFKFITQSAKEYKGTVKSVIVFQKKCLTLFKNINFQGPRKIYCGEWLKENQQQGMYNSYVNGENNFTLYKSFGCSGPKFEFKKHTFSTGVQPTRFQSATLKCSNEVNGLKKKLSKDELARIEKLTKEFETKNNKTKYESTKANTSDNKQSKKENCKRLHSVCKKLEFYRERCKQLSKSVKHQK